MPPIARMRLLLLPLLVLVVAIGGCTTTPRKGEQRWVFAADAADPTNERVLVIGPGKGTATNGGVSAGYEYFGADNVAIGAHVGYRFFDQSDGPVHAGELNVSLRTYVLEAGRWWFSLDALGGLMLGSRAMPEAGTHFNFTFGLGPTVEFHLDDRVQLFANLQFRHYSNGKGSVPNNPTQNDFRLSLGVALRW